MDSRVVSTEQNQLASDSVTDGCYQKAKRVLHTSLPDCLVGREKELHSIQSFLREHITHRRPGSLYVSGAPGSGKTAAVTKIIESLQDIGSCRVIYINCTSLKNSLAIYNNVLSTLRRSESSLSSKEACRQIEEYITSADSPTVVLVLDEMDFLDSKNQDVLYTMFEWPALSQSTLVLVGIANSLDLTDRILPRLQTRSNYRPQLLSFPPYTKDEIVEVIKERLSKIGGDDIFDNMALELCARKVAALAGDIRMALNVCKQAVEVIEAEARRSHLPTSNKNVSQGVSILCTKKVGVSQIHRILGQVSGARVKLPGGGCDDQLTMPLQQELAMHTLLIMLHGGRSKEVSLGKFHENYSKNCAKSSIKIVDQSEFHSLCSLIEARGLIGLKKARDTRSIKVSLKVDENELKVLLRDKTLAHTILQKGY